MTRITKIRVMLLIGQMRITINQSDLCRACNQYEIFHVKSQTSDLSVLKQVPKEKSVKLTKAFFCSARHFTLSVFSCMLPATMILVLGFFAILHSWLNAFAEMTRFADRMFYKVCKNWYYSYHSGQQVPLQVREDSHLREVTESHCVLQNCC